MNIIPRTSRARWQLFGLTIIEILIILITIVALFLTWYEGGGLNFLKKIEDKIDNSKYYFLFLRILLTFFFCGSLIFLLIPVWKKQKGYVLADAVFGFLFQPQNFVFPDHFELRFYEEKVVEQQKEKEKEKLTSEQLYHKKLLLILEAMTAVLDQNKQLLGELSSKTLALQKEHDSVFRNLSVLVSELIKLPSSTNKQPSLKVTKDDKLEEQFFSQDEDFKGFFKNDDENESK